MNVILLTSNMTNTGGIQRLVQVLSNEFIKIYENVTIINIGKNKGELKFKLDSRININFVGCDEINLESCGLIKKIKYTLVDFFKIKKYLNICKFEDKKTVVIAFGHNLSCMLPLLIKKDSNIKLIGSQHNPITYKNIYNLIRNFLLPRLDSYIVLSKSMEDDLLTHINLSNTVVLENPNTLVATKVSNLDNKNVLAIGRLTEQKGFDILIDMWKEINIARPNWNLKIIGEGYLENKLKSQVKELNLNSTISIESYTNLVENEYINSSIFVLTSRYEGFGLVIIEAQSCGLPIVSFDCDFGPRNIINDKKDGFLIKNGNKKEFIEKLIMLMDNKILREELSKNAKSNSDRFSLDNIINKWKNLMESI